MGWTNWLGLTLLRRVAEAGVDDASCRSVRALHILLKTPAAFIPGESVKKSPKRTKNHINRNRRSCFWWRKNRVKSLLKGQYPEIFYSGFFIKELLLVWLYTHRKNFEFFWMLKDLFVFIINFPVYSPLGSRNSLVYSNLGVGTIGVFISEIHQWRMHRRVV